MMNNVSSDENENDSFHTTTSVENFENVTNVPTKSNKRKTIESNERLDELIKRRKRDEQEIQRLLIAGNESKSVVEGSQINLPKKFQLFRSDEVIYGREDDYIEIQHADRIEVRLPWLDHGYDWRPHVSDEFDQKKKRNIKKIPHDMFHHANAITLNDGKKYCKFLEIEENETNLKNCVEEITMLRDKYRKFIVDLIYKFWFDIANKIGIAKEQSYIFDSKMLMHSICSISTLKDCNKLVLLLYIVFDWMGNYQIQIIDLMEQKYSIELMKPPTVMGKRRILHCVHLLVTQMVNNERKVLNDAIRKTFGIHILLTKFEKKEKKEGTVNKAFRLKKCIYPWMIRGEFVS